VKNNPETQTTIRDEGPPNSANAVSPGHIAAGHTATQRRLWVQICQLYMRTRPQDHNSHLLAGWNLRPHSKRPRRCWSVHFRVQWKES